MSNIGQVPEELNVGRGDPVYMAHGYLTKVPVTAIIPFIEQFSRVGDVVVDPFAGSGMTGVAAAALGRRAQLFDISILGRHIGRNYTNLVDGGLLRKQANELVANVIGQLGEIYQVGCASCGRFDAGLVKTVWSIQVECDGCGAHVSYFRAMEAASWSKKTMCCPGCGTLVSTKCKKVGERAEVDSVRCECSAKQHEQHTTAPGVPVDIESLDYPRVEITPDRQMYKAQSLGRSGLTSIRSFYSERNLAVLTLLREQIGQVADEKVRSKLLFAFTAILTRASKRYQWSPIRPLNAANSNYYVAPVFYEWNVFELFLRKIEAAVKSDDWLRTMRGSESLFDSEVAELDVQYEIGSAVSLPLADASVDYVFTDPPFGSNLFYADMALFQEAWLDGFTDVGQEAVVDRGTQKQRSAGRYEGMLTEALRECRRVLKAKGRVSMVFGNSSGAMWSLVQRAISGAGLRIEPEELVVLNKGQRSVKGLASGFEHVATLDLIMTMTAADVEEVVLVRPSAEEVTLAARSIAERESDLSPSHIYLELLRQGIRDNWDLATLDLRDVTGALMSDGWDVNPVSGRLSKVAAVNGMS